MPTILGGGALTEGYSISNSMRFGGQNGNAVLQKTFSSDGNRKKFTIAKWFKGTASFSYISGTQTSGSNYFQYGFTDSGTIRVFQGDGSLNVETSRTFGDASAWYHIVLQIDTTQGTNTNRVKFYVNGEQETSMATTTYPNQNLDLFFNKDSHNMGVGNRGDADGAFVKGYLADYYFVDNATVAPSTFAETDDNGIWIPKDSADVIDAVTFGTNGFFMNFQQTGTSANSSGMGADTSGNDNHFVSTNTNATNITTDTPTNNFCTLNPLAKGADATLAEGNCQIAYDNNTRSTSTANMGIANGKWYWEFKITADGNAAPCSAMFGIGQLPFGPDLGTYLGQNASGWGYAGEDGTVYNSGSNSAYGATYTTGDIIGVAFDADNGNLYFYKNGTIQNSGTAAVTGLTSSSTGFYYPAVGDSSGAQTFTAQANFGNPPFAISSGNSDGLYGNFEYAVPSGYYALCTKRLAQFG